jgi:biotin operon repressor
MSFQAMAWAAAQKLPTRDKFVLVMMANYADEIGKCWPSLNRLSAETSMSRSTVQLAIKALADAGLLRIEQRYQDGVSLPNHYFLTLTGVYREPVHHTENEEGVYRQPVGGIPTVGTKPIKEPIKESLSAFDDFWSAYPRKTAKEAARKAWASVTKKTPPAEIMSGLARHTFPTDVQFIPHPATWLNQHRWADEGVSVTGNLPKRDIPIEEQIEMSRRFWAQYEGNKQ